jgi:prepilin-type processing-associated H-X9-DG protein/prepilin-type N-terminal cleavage/methylation domain-containing protein
VCATSEPRPGIGSFARPWPSDSHAREGFTLVELLIVLAAVALLAGMIFPVLSWSRASGRSADCRSRLHQIGIALQLYSEEHDGYLPLVPHWDYAVYTRMRISTPFSCPDTRSYNPRHWPPDYLGGYAYNAALEHQRVLPQGSVVAPRRLQEFVKPTSTVSFCDARVGLIKAGGPDVHHPGDPAWEEGGRRHLNGANYLFLDGHVKWYRPEAVRSWFPPTRPGSDGSGPSFQP